MPPDFSRIPAFDEAWGNEFTNSMREYIGALEMQLEMETMTGDQMNLVPTLSGDYFCGCSDCYERESWLMAVKLTIEGYEAGKVKLEKIP